MCSHEPVMDGLIVMQPQANTFQFHLMFEKRELNIFCDGFYNKDKAIVQCC